MLFVKFCSRLGIYDSDVWFTWADPEEGGDRRPDPPGKTQVVIGFLSNTGTDPPREAIGPLWVQLLLEGGSYGILRNTLIIYLPVDGIFWIRT